MKIPTGQDEGEGGGINLTPLIDVVFLLLIFFMVTTVFRKEKKRDIEWVDAEATEKIEEKRKNILHIWIQRSGEVWINDVLTPFEDISEVVRPIYAENREVVVALRGDRDVPYRQINTITEELQEAGAVRVTFATRLEQRAMRARR